MVGAIYFVEERSWSFQSIIVKKTFRSYSQYCGTLSTNWINKSPKKKKERKKIERLISVEKFQNNYKLTRSNDEL